ncbi:MAG: hypothetical protein FWE95_03110 [Planctomycetaceae bacterium]|nr:hypothetical protein [Planctomycetaceae bacterium]
MTTCIGNRVMMAVIGMLIPLLLPAVQAAGELVEKPSSTDIPRLVPRATPSVPEGFTEVPYSEDHLPPAPTDLEKQQGFILFSRPITQAIHHGSVPQEVERIEGLSAFATLGELEPANFAVYALREMKDFRVVVSPLMNDAGQEIPADHLDLRLVTEYPIGFPAYTSPQNAKTYRMTPELLERVNVVESIPSGESRRFWIIMRVPADAEPGIYRGSVTMYDEANEQALRIPLSLRVLGFSLLRDPTRHYTAYAYNSPREYFNARGETLARYRTNEYKAMLDYGFDMMPTVYLRAFPNAQGDFDIRFQEPEIIDMLLELGFTGPIVAVDAGFSSFYRKYVPGSTIESHFVVNKHPETDEVYEKFEKALREFKQTVDGKYPEIIIGPIDEPSPASGEIAIKALQAVQKAGFRSYMTVDSASPTAEMMREHNAVDIYCMQPYSLSFDQVMADTRYEYWLYPNHNATEIRDTTIMQKGGRMTYGYGKWRSGYKVTIPWHWRWVINNEDPFDYLRGRGMSGSGNRMDEDGNVIPAVYWECFREGYDDYRYVYTLQQRIIERENHPNQDCQRVVAEARKFVEDLWLDIEVQPKYLKTEFWDDKQFDAYRWQAARFIETLLKYPKVNDTVNDTVAPTVIFDPGALSASVVAEDLFSNPNMEVFSLTDNRFAGWGTIEREVSFTVADSTDLSPQRPILRTVFTVDHESGGQYPISWPGVSARFPNNTVSLGDYDYVYFKVKVESNRSETEDASTIVRIYASNHGAISQGGNVLRNLGGIQRTWIPMLVPVSEILANADSRSDSRAFLQAFRFHLFEADYKHGTRMELDFADVSLLRSKFPSVERIIAPSLMFQGERWLGATIELLGKNSNEHTLSVKLIDSNGTAMAEEQRALTGERNDRVNLDMSDVKAGIYSLRATITDSTGATLSEQERRVEVAERDY